MAGMIKAHIIVYYFSVYQNTTKLTLQSHIENYPSHSKKFFFMEVIKILLK